MAEILASAIITVLFEKLTSVGLMSLARSEGMDSQLNKWKKDLPMIQAVLADAGQKHITQRAVEIWLHDLQDLAYDIDDVLDDLATEALKRELNQESHASTSSGKLLKIIPTCCTNFTPHNIMYGRQMSCKLDEITTKLNDLVERKILLGLDVNVKVGRSDRRLEETSLLQVDESKVLGREGDKEALIRKLLGDDDCKQNVSIVPIVGLGGIGKTTLARLVYNAEKVEDHFELRAWVCVSDEFDVFNISKAIYQAVNGENKEFANLDLLQVALKEKLSKKLFLVVLDDVWNEDHKQWDLLQSPFLVGAPGSKIVVTTRKTKVALVMNSFQPYNLEVLPPETSLSLFAEYALNEQNFDKYPSLESIAQGIIHKCRGLPLALIALGRVLKTKGRSDNEWEEILNSEIWNLEDESDILPALKLSYYDLPGHLKQLFAYCSLFPKDFLFDKNELVLLWMAEGFLSQFKGNKSMETLGHQYFEELQSRSFFQRSTNNESEYMMHDLMNDLAISVAGEFFFLLDDKADISGRAEAFEKLRHFSFIGQRHASYRKFKEIHRARCLRTFLPVSVGWQSFDNLHNVLVELLPRLQFLRVLSVTDNSITEVPQSIGSLKHLRYLDFSQTWIERVPEEVSDLYNLQSLLVRYCRKLTSLPVSFVKLINLRHLDMSDTPLLNKTPLGIGGLTSLRTLSKVYIEETNGFKLSELKCLQELQGGLSIKGLDKVKNPTQANDAALQQTKGLDHLDMEWSDVFDDSRNSNIEYKVLESLRPHVKLRKLNIYYYGGMKFPSWVGDPAFDQLTELTLEGCRSTYLPTLGHLSSLRVLHVSQMHEVKIVDHGLLAPTEPFHGITFPSLESMTIDNMQGLEIWSTRGADDDGTASSFPSLRQIIIQQCPKLVEVSVGLMPSLTDLWIVDCFEAVLRAMVSMSPSIHTLMMVNIIGLENCNCPNSVEELDISNCSSMTSLTFSTLHELPSSLNIRDKDFGFLPHICLRRLWIRGCENFKSLPQEHLQSLTFLEELDISFCPSMDYSFPCGLWPPNLKSLSIGRLNKPMSEWGLQNYPTSLVSLRLWGENSGVVSFAVKEEEGSSTTFPSTSFLLPPSLTYLGIYYFEDVVSLSEVLQHLPRLEYLNIHSCPNLRDLPETTSSLDVYNH